MTGYTRKPMSSPGSFIKLKSKGDKVRVRILSEAYREPKVWEDGVKAPLSSQETKELTKEEWIRILREPTFTVSETFIWIVWDYSDKTAKIFQGTGGVYSKVKDFNDDPEWGDPTQYDFTIERTEEPGKNYYKVTPSPNKVSPSQDMLERAGRLDISSKAPAARPAESKGLDEIYIKDALKGHEIGSESITDPFNNTNSEEPINVEDIPY